MERSGSSSALADFSPAYSTPTSTTSRGRAICKRISSPPTPRSRLREREATIWRRASRPSRRRPMRRALRVEWTAPSSSIVSRPCSTTTDSSTQKIPARTSPELTMRTTSSTDVLQTPRSTATRIVLGTSATRALRPQVTMRTRSSTVEMTPAGGARSSSERPMGAPATRSPRPAPAGSPPA